MQQLPLRDLFDKYVQYCAVIKNYSKTTITGYKTSFQVFLRDTGIVTLDQLNKYVIESFFFNGRLKRKWGPVTFRHYLKHLNTFSKWLIRQELLDRNYLDDIEKPRMEHRIPRTLNKDQALLVLDAAFHMKYTYKFEKYKNRAIIGLMLLSGLRRQEVLNLKTCDVSLDNRSIFINQSKGKKDRIVPMNAKLYGILEEYLKDRERLGYNSIFFFNPTGKGEIGCGEKGINKLMEKLRKKTKLNFSSHALRHSFATLMLEGGCDIYTLSKIMGHNKITTTTIYLSCSNHQMSKCIEMHSLN